MPEYGPHMPLPGPPQMCPGPYPGPPPAHYPPYPSPEFTRVDADVPKGPYFNGAAAPPPRQKGRPRKKKPKDQDIMTANLGKSHDNTLPQMLYFPHIDKYEGFKIIMLLL